ncbi:hypothetical protein U1Q18_038429 [Sarracenia purpurea var. burkii]
MERFAFKGVASNLVSYLTDVVKMSNSSAAKTVNSWCGFTSMMPLLVAPFADSYWDHYSTLLVSSCFYVLGLAALTSTAFLRTPIINKPISTSPIFWSLYMISVGQGGYNPSLQAFGADQLQNEEDELPCSTSQGNSSSDEKKSRFFRWWYFGVCSGSLLGVSTMSYVEETLGWGYGFAVPTVVMVASVASLSCGRRFFACGKSKDGVDDKAMEKIVRSIKGTATRVMNGGRFVFLTNKSNVVELELDEKPLCHEDDDEKDTEGSEKSTSSGIDLPEIAKVTFHLLPIWTVLLIFAVIFQQPPTFFTKQGMVMKRNIGPAFRIPPATLQTAITASIILLMPFYDSVFVPICRLFTRNEKGITVMQRMGAGMFLSTVAMAVAAVVETKRLRSNRDAESERAALSIFWLLPQYVLLGISDIFTVVGMQEFFYGEVPAGMRTMGIALYTSVFGVGSFLSALLISVVERLTSSGEGKQSWFADDLNQARLDKFYWVLAFASALSLLIFIVLCRCYKSRL